MAGDEFPMFDAGGGGSADDFPLFELEAAVEPEKPARPAGAAREIPARLQRTPGQPARRRHAAKGSRQAAVALSVFTAGGLTMMFASSDSSTSVTTVTVPAGRLPPIVVPTTIASGGTTVATTSPPATIVSIVPTVPQTTVPAPLAGFKPGTYDGAPESNKWGIVQVEITTDATSITGVQILQYPNSKTKSVEINTAALPTLQSETLAAQSAHVDGVSGATYTSGSYVLSLQSAIDLAKTP